MSKATDIESRTEASRLHGAGELPPDAGIAKAAEDKAAKTAPKQQPTVGRIVHYRLTDAEAEAITRRRTSGGGEHRGNPVAEGTTVPMLVVATWDGSAVNGQAFLDGNDVLWVTSAKEGTAPGTWCWPARS